jgi:predicted TIM-barrel fold metal-dependent hydrolase
MAAEFIDCAVHPTPAKDSDFSAYLPRPLRDRSGALSPLFSRGVTNPPFDEFVKSSVQGGVAGSSRELLANQMRANHTGAAILTPLTRGLVPDVRTAASVAAATNNWLADHWLEGDSADGPQLYGSIRISARDAGTAVAEIDRWSRHGRFVQVAVSTESLSPYGQEQFFPIWKAAADRNLPVLLLSDRARGIGGPSTPLGEPRYHLEAMAQVPFADATHLASLVSEGVFERLPNLTFVLGDGGFSVDVTLLWRVTNDWRAGRYEVPWAAKPPIEYLENVRFLLDAGDSPGGPEQLRSLLQSCEAERLVMYGSRYPYWDMLETDTVERSVPAPLAGLLLHDNARRTYMGLGPHSARD